MIDFELAKQPRDHGFAQPEDDGVSDRAYTSDGELTSYDNCCGFWRNVDYDAKVSYVATLSELMQTCGDNFVRLMKKGRCLECVGLRRNDFSGSTAEEPVARLWLALNQK